MMRLVAGFAVAVASAGVLASATRAATDCQASPGITSRPTSCPFVFYQSSDVPKPIPDGLGSVSSVVNVPTMAPLMHVELQRLSIMHPWIGDLKVSLTSPGGTTVVLIDQVCNLPPGAANFSNITLRDSASQPIGSFCPPASSGSYRPGNPLSTFNGEPANGTWTLTVSDVQLTNLGTLEGWGLWIGVSCTRVEVASFGATRAKKSALVRWRTGSEIGVAGFNVYREQARKQTRRNRALTRASGASGHAYAFRDRLQNAAPARYWLEAVHLDGSRTRHGPAKLR